MDALLLGPQRRRMSMNRSLCRLTVGDAAPVSQRPARRGRGVLVWATAVAVVGVLVWQTGVLDGGSVAAAHRNGESDVAASRPLGSDSIPPPQLPASKERLLPAVTDAPDSSAYRLMKADGVILRFEPCRPIKYVVHDAEQRPVFDRLLDDAIAEVSDATGLKFVREGTTSEAPTVRAEDRPPYQPKLYGERWAPVVIAWSDGVESPDLAGTTAGHGGPQSWGRTQTTVHAVSGQVAFDLPDLETLMARDSGKTLVYEVMLHELGHLVGMQHVPDKNQIMYRKETQPIAHYQDGDRAGLAVLGDGACYPDY
jgi:hypothetical protein